MRHRGTPSVTLAAQSTLVSPNSTSADPSACFCQCRVMATGRSSSGFRPSGRVTPATLVARVRGFLPRSGDPGRPLTSTGAYRDADHPHRRAAGGARHHRRVRRVRRRRAGRAAARVRAARDRRARDHRDRRRQRRRPAGRARRTAARGRAVAAPARQPRARARPRAARARPAVRDRARRAAAGCSWAPGSRSAWSTRTATTRAARSGCPSSARPSLRLRSRTSRRP